jgi:hypothetical protein
MQPRIFSMNSKSKHSGGKCCRPKIPLIREEVKTTIVADTAALQSATPVFVPTSTTPTIVIPGDPPATTNIPLASASAATFGVPLVFSIFDPNVNSKITAVGSTGAFTGLRVVSAPFGFKSNDGISIVANIGTSAAAALNDFLLTLVFVPDNTLLPVVPYTSATGTPAVSATPFPTALGNTRYDFLFSNIGNANSSTISTPGRFEFRIMRNLSALPTTITTVAPSTFNLFVNTKTVTSCFVPL